MSRIQLVTQFIAYFPGNGDRGREELAQTTGQIGVLGFEVIRNEPYLLAVIASGPTTVAGSEATLLDVFPGTEASKRIQAANFDDAGSIDEVHRKAETSAQCYNLLQATNTSFRLESDAFGLKPVHVARTRGGNVMCSRIADLLTLFPALAEPIDPAGLYELLGYWVPLVGRTLHRQVRRTPPGGCYRWTPDAGLSGRRGRDLSPVPVEPLGFMDQTIAAIRDTSLQSLREKTAGAPEPVLLALSGGFDSRLIAAMCHDLHIRIQALNYGQRHNRETHSARAIARTLGINLKMVPLRKDTTLRYLPHQLRAIEGTADPAAAAIMELFHATPSTQGSALLHGFGGDLQSGGHMNRFSAADFASREAVADAIARRYYPPARADLPRLFEPAPDLDEVRQDVLDGLKDDCPPYQAYLLWFLENRNRRFVGSQCSVLGEHFDVIMPFYDRKLFDLWHSLPPIALMDRAVFRKLMARYYPALARIPHAEEPAPIIPNLHWQLRHYYHRLPYRLLAQCIGSERSKQVFLRLYRHDGIRSLSSLAAPKQRAYMLSQIDQLRPTLREGLGLELSPHYETILAGDLQALRAMFMVANYAQDRCEVRPSALADATVALSS